MRQMMHPLVVEPLNNKNSYQKVETVYTPPLSPIHHAYFLKFSACSITLS